MTLTRRDYIIITALLAALTAGFAIAAGSALWFLAFCGFAVAVVTLWFHIEWGLYVMAALFPFIAFQFISGDVNVQYVDLVAMLVALVWGVKVLTASLLGTGKISARWFPAALPMLLFIISAALSLGSVESEFLQNSIKFIFRPLAFFYIMYVMLPCAIISTDAILMRVLRTMFWVGIFISCMGLWSLLFPPIKGLLQAIPVPIFGFNLMGSNHNLIAEILVMVLPIGYVLFFRTKDIFYKNLYLIGTALMGAITLLTLSRSGWLAVAVELVLLILLQYRTRLNELVRSYGLYIGLVLVLPAMILMYRLATSFVSISSNISRLKLISIAYELFRSHPLVGNGAGAFVRLVSDVQWWIIEYGEPLDAHGMYFKVLAEQGILGVCAWTLLLGVIVHRLYRAYQMTRGTQWGIITAAGLLSVVGGITFQLFSTSYYLSNFWLPVGVALAAAELASAHFKTHGEKN